MKPRTGNSNGFTLIELIVTITIASIIAVTAVPAFMNMNNTRLWRASSELAGHIKMARSLAMATRRRTWIRFNTAGESYETFIEHRDQPGRASRIAVTHPVTGASSFVVSLDQDEFTGVQISSASFGGQAEVEFDWLGRPYNGWGTLLSNDGTVVLAADTSQTVRVTAGTGMVSED
ncbi:MAG: prepilin-type N-terminal cleavage/methylation domain-containing protein [Planctomycetota bacterium]